MDTKKSISRFFCVNYVLMILSLTSFTFFDHHSNISSILFMAAVVLSYAFVYLFPTGVLLWIIQTTTKMLGVAERLYARLFVYAAAVLGLTLTHLVILTDRVIYKMYGFHFNGFVWNILTTKGGIESMGFDAMAYWTCGGMLLGAVFAECLLLMICLRWETFRISRISRVPHVMRVAMPCAAMLMLAVQGVFFGISSFKGYSDVLVSSRVFPFYLPITFRGLLADMGFESNGNTILTADASENEALEYPLKAIEQAAGSPRYNIVWLVAESWRADMLTEEIMPQTWKFARRSQQFTHHYSGGNGTRNAMFGMFYGLYGNYWPEFLRERRPPVLMDFLGQNGYAFGLYTSARFTYPEFDKTIFSSVPAESLHEYATSAGWQSDRYNVSQMLDFIDSRDTNKPFMTFMFFESPHARYYFPPECEIRKDYLKEFNYATADLERDSGLIFNRYVNACNHLDTQLARVIEHLEAENLLDTTLVIITGDHGEEFMEHGRWGHNSAFVDEQIKTPLILRIPGMEPAEHTRMTSHLDIPATLMHVLGVNNPPSDFSLGINLFSQEQRHFAVLSDWDSLVYLDGDYKIVLPFKLSASFGASNQMTTADEKRVADASGVLSKKAQNLARVLQDSAEFTKVHQQAD